MGAALLALQIIVGGGMASAWDDETFLGRGPWLTAGVAKPLTRHLAVEAAVDATWHHRDSGYLKSESSTLAASARLMWKFRGPEKGFRPFVAAGGSVTRTEGSFTPHTVVPGPGLFPVAGPDEVVPWDTTTLPGWDLAAGAEIGSGRLTWRPEIRWTATTNDYTARNIEPAFWIPRLGVTAAWKIRK